MVEYDARPVAKRSRVSKAQESAREVAKNSVKGGRGSRLQYFKNMRLNILSELSGAAFLLRWCLHCERPELTRVFHSLDMLASRFSDLTLHVSSFEEDAGLTLISISFMTLDRCREAVHHPDLDANDFSEHAYASLVHERSCLVC